MARANKANRKGNKNREFGSRKTTTRESVAKAQANAPKKVRRSGGAWGIKPPGGFASERVNTTHCRECGIEFEMLDPLGDDVCDGCYEALYEEEGNDNIDYDDVYEDDDPFPDLDWMCECPD